MSIPLEDRAEISDLLAHYGFALDLRQWDELRDVFTEDAVIHYSGTTEHTGIDDIVTFFRTTATSLAATQHLSLTLPGSGPHAKLGVAEALEVHGPDEALVVGNRHDE